MNECVSYTVQYVNDVLDPVVSDTQVYGLECDIFRSLFNTYFSPNSLEHNKEYILDSREQLGVLSRLAARILPADIVSSDNDFFTAVELQDNEYSVISHAEPDSGVVNMLMPVERERLVMSKDPDLTQQLYRRYAQLYNQGEAIFGARLVNIQSIRYTIHNFE